MLTKLLCCCFSLALVLALILQLPADDDNLWFPTGLADSECLFLCMYSSILRLCSSLSDLSSSANLMVINSNVLFVRYAMYIFNTQHIIQTHSIQQLNHSYAIGLTFIVTME